MCEGGTDMRWEGQTICPDVLTIERTEELAIANNVTGEGREGSAALVCPNDDDDDLMDSSARL